MWYPVSNRLVLTEKDFDAVWDDFETIANLLYNAGIIFQAEPGKERRPLAGHMAVASVSKLASLDPVLSIAECIVFERALNFEQWAEGKTYDVNARIKAYMSARDRLPSRVVVREGKEQEGDFPFPGSIIKNGMAPGFSGGPAVDDEILVRLFLALAIRNAYGDTDRNPPLPAFDTFVGGAPNPAFVY